MTQQKTLMTADKFFDFCDRNDGRYELVQGEVVEFAPINEQHGNAAFNISGAFHSYSRRHGIGRGAVETGYRLREDPDTVLGPDVSFNLDSKPRLALPQSGFVSGSPDIAVEVVSPSNTAAEMQRKVSQYIEAGSRRVWLVYPPTPTSPGWVAIHRPDSATVTYTGGDTITDEDLLPGFSLPLAEIFD